MRPEGHSRERSNNVAAKKAIKKLQKAKKIGTVKPLSQPPTETVGFSFGKIQH
jgi:hypothetical protein